MSQSRCVWTISHQVDSVPPSLIGKTDWTMSSSWELPQRLVKDPPTNSLFSENLLMILLRNSLETLANDPLTNETLADDPLEEIYLETLLTILLPTILLRNSLSLETLADNPLKELSLWGLLLTILLRESLRRLLQ